ncbi:putative cytosol aminopeptidase [Dermatophagoides farinae]|uniref:putative cytosol aminopeptidase n=1 Tax=Dermatophagoides farinae TaxID=6954 RepID=UPI003F6127D2
MFSKKLDKSTAVTDGTAWELTRIPVIDSDQLLSIKFNSSKTDDSSCIAFLILSHENELIDSSIPICESLKEYVLKTKNEKKDSIFECDLHKLYWAWTDEKSICDNNNLMELAYKFSAYLRKHEAKVESLSVFIDLVTSSAPFMTFLSRLFFESYISTLYKSEQKEVNFPKIISFSASRLTISEKDSIEILETAKKLALASIRMKNLVEAPPNVCHCEKFLDYVKKEVPKYKNLYLTYCDENQCLDAGMGAFYSVSRASEHGGRLIHITYKSGNPTTKIGLVGKGITMDTGGYSLKSCESIMTMKYDMTGAALVTSTILAIASLEIKDIEVHAVALLTANAINEKATFPGSIVKAYNGKTIEILNTDAEGRLVLADGLTYLSNVFENSPNSYIIDVATLTGAMAICLGTEIAGLFTNSDKLTSFLYQASKDSGENIFRMPLHEKYKSLIKSKIADLSNIANSKPNASSMTAALFLQEFVGDKIHWAHLDIAGVSWRGSKAEAKAWGILLLYKAVLELSGTKQ